jgi:hypothetical protein
MSRIKVNITKWKDHNARTDVKRPSWFRLDNRLVEDSDFFDFDGDEFKAWIYILSLASQKNKDTIVIVFAHAEKVANIPKTKLLSAIDKLVQNESLAVIGCSGDTSTVRERYANGSHPASTLHNTTLHNTTEQNRTGESSGDDMPSAADLFATWNNFRGDLPKAQKLTNVRKQSAKARLKENPNLEYWREVIKKLATAPFTSGQNDRGWRADFDFLLKPDTHIKVSEGKYDSRKGAGLGVSKAQQTSSNLKQMWLAREQAKRVGGDQ